MGLAVSALYFIGSWSGGRRATLGQRLLKIQVGNAFDGRPLTLDQAIRRWLGFGEFIWLIGFVPGLAGFSSLYFLWALVLLITTAASPTKQGLHDRLANSAVVRPVNAGNGLAISCVVILLILLLIPLLSIVALIFLGSQVSSILSASRRVRLTTSKYALDAAQVDGLVDMDAAAFRAAAHQVADLIAEYLEHVEDHAVFPPIEPGSLRPTFPSEPPETAEAIDAILADYDRLVVPNATHWQHPGFMAYFATTASGPGILGEMLTAALGQNPMLWRTSPIGTELEEVVVDWLRQGLGLPVGFDGLLTDTASTSSLIALAAAREATGLDIAARGLAGRPDVPPIRVYASQEAHSSIEKACMTLGIGREGLVRIPVDDAFAMRPEALDAAIQG